MTAASLLVKGVLVGGTAVAVHKAVRDAEPKALTRWGMRHGTANLAAWFAQRSGDAYGLLCGEELRAEPYAFYDELRARGDLVPGKVACVTASYDLCAEVVRDPAFLSGFPDETLPRPFQAALEWAREDAVLSPLDRPSMLMSNGADHTRFRRLVSKAFTARAVAALRVRTEEIAGELLDGLERKRAAGEPVDLVVDYAEQLPVWVIAELLGVPTAMREQFLTWMHPIAALTDLGMGYPAFRRAEASLRELNAWTLGHLERLRREPGDDLLSRIVAGSEEERAAGGEGLSETDLMITTTLMLGAGFETTVNLISNGAALLMAHPDQAAVLRDDPSVWANAVEEMLRLDSAVQNTYRYPAQSTVVRGVPVRRGQFIIVLLGAANRDPAVFPEPGRFDVRRANAREHLSFSLGPHFCVGAALARMEGEVALARLFERYPDLALDGAPARRPTRGLRGYLHMPVALGSPAILRSDDPSERLRQKYQGNGDQSGSRFSRNESRPSTASSVM